MKHICLSGSEHVALVDDEDYDRLSKWKWHLHRSNYGHFTVARSERINGRSKTFYMHREVMNATPEMRVDHINHDTLDNRRSNLRGCSHEENARNRRLNKNSATGFKGVYRYKWRGGLWFAMISVSKKLKMLGYFDSPEDAARAYDDAARIYHGEFCHLNFR